MGRCRRRIASSPFLGFSPLEVFAQRPFQAILPGTAAGMAGRAFRRGRVLPLAFILLIRHRGPVRLLPPLLSDHIVFRSPSVQSLTQASPSSFPDAPFGASLSPSSFRGAPLFLARARNPLGRNNRGWMDSGFAPLRFAPRTDAESFRATIIPHLARSLPSTARSRRWARRWGTDRSAARI
jgi:hypothetical protein